MGLKQRKLLFIFLSSILLALILAIPVGKLYNNILQPARGFIGPSNPEYFDGFLLSYLFFISFLFFILLKENKFLKALLFTFPILILFLFIPPYEYLLVGLGLIIVGAILGQLISFLKPRLKPPAQ